MILPTLHLHWSQDLLIDLYDSNWANFLGYVLRISRNARLKLLQFDNIQCTYLTPTQLHTVFGGVPH